MKSSQSCPDCELKETCSFYWNYRDDPLVRESSILETYCRVPLASNRCERISYFLIHGDFPPADLAPDGIRMSALVRLPAS